MHPYKECLERLNTRQLCDQVSDGLPNTEQTVFGLPPYSVESDLEPKPLLSIAQGKSKIGELTYGLRLRVWQETG